MEAGNLGEAPGRANRARLGLLRFPMPSLSSIAAHFGAAAAASLLAAAGLAFEAGRAGASETAPVMLIEREDAGLMAAAAPGLDEAEFIMPAAPAQPVAEAAPEAVRPRPILAVIIDDVGLSRSAFDRLMGVEAPLTLAFLPYGEAAPAMAREAGAAGREVFLHLPMEPVGLDDPGPMALTRHLDDAEIVRRAEWALSRVPGATGFNNHMGSALTSDGRAIRAAMAAFAGSKLIFVDSVTSPRSLADRAAREAGLTSLRRDVFLDNARNRAAIDARIDEAVALAAERGWAVAIGHPYPVTLDALEDLAARAEAAGVEIVTVAAIAAKLAADAGA
jgi:polysaccharide deacetylase 2 family uncharacterized protein YibQ